MLLPYYIASMNIEHAYWTGWASTSHSRELPGDTFELAEPKQAGFEFMTRQHRAHPEAEESAIFVVIGTRPITWGR